MSLFDSMKFSRLKKGLTKTRETIFEKIQTLLSSKSTIDDEFIENLEEILLSADVGVSTTMEIVQRIRERLKKDVQNSYGIDAFLFNEIRQFVVNGSDEEKDPLTVSSEHRPHVIMVVGVNGVGKTTTIGKLAYLYKTSGKKVLIAAADTFRAAANKQLEIWALRSEVEIIQSHTSRGTADPGAVAFDALRAAIARQVDVMIIDTAGRLHTKTNLMEELKKIKHVLMKQMPEAPHEVLLVLDASIGQNAIQQAKQFDDAVGLTGIVVTKLDGTAKGGIVLAITKELSVPVTFIGVGEKIDDLQPFDSRAFVEALFKRE